ncbi:polysaccharide deacetylase [Arthrobacter crystallopoietes BAB-32]|uniref:Polysaccharide deacetylase n=1 Tax=Arthrobacter crystallopoietes BAB-32 TaxID=1246476 RepID=N1UW40_9MICC|nr:polysaccharide deacetylase family protein [Arthrobacter crystallopoietes]EMY33260.1 polysaccharide deacetylase [Arthrobacter crystallopoietes BAB-32]
MGCRRRIAILLSVAALVVSAHVLSPPASAAPAYDIRRGPNHSERVVLTFDDCPRSLDSFESVVEYAYEENIGLVLALTGKCITEFLDEEDEDLVRLARQHGQYVINHSINHRDLRQFTCAQVAAELRAPGVVTNFGRPPHGGINKAVRCGYERVKMRPWLWNFSTRDWTGKSRSEVVDSVVANSRKGATVLMHMQWRGFDPRALDRMKEGLEDRGLRLCRAYGGATGGIRTSPTMLPQRLPC